MPGLTLFAWGFFCGLMLCALVVLIMGLCSAAREGDEQVEHACREREWEGF